VLALDDTSLANVIAQGVPAHAAMIPEQLADLVALMRSWQL
jgi:hypothetical protein